MGAINGKYLGGGGKPVLVYARNVQPQGLGHLLAKSAPGYEKRDTYSLGPRPTWPAATIDDFFKKPEYVNGALPHFPDKWSYDNIHGIRVFIYNLYDITRLHLYTEKNAKGDDTLKNIMREKIYDYVLYLHEHTNKILDTIIASIVIGYNKHYDTYPAVSHVQAIVDTIHKNLQIRYDRASDMPSESIKNNLCEILTVSPSNVYKIVIGSIIAVIIAFIVGLGIYLQVKSKEEFTSNVNNFANMYYAPPPMRSSHIV